MAANAGDRYTVNMAQRRKSDTYHGFEQGPIRPPSEAHSLLIRLTRNCPWNRCTFCPVYKGTSFSLRGVAHVKKDIDAVHRHVETLRKSADDTGHVPRQQIDRLTRNLDPEDTQAFVAAYHWFSLSGMKSVFLQDANSIVMKSRDLVEILTHLRRRFPSIQRVTTYARSQTIAHKKDADLKAIRDAGLDRLHVGLESGSDAVLEFVKKGATKDMHVQAGRKAKAAGFELSEYFMPGLGGRRLSQAHAVESADALNAVNPHFIRLRTLAIPPGSPLSDDLQSGRFQKCADIEVVKELLTFIEKLDGITSIVTSDHILNIFEDLQGTLPQDKEYMLDILRTFLAMTPERQGLYLLGRRLGVLSSLHDMQDAGAMARVEKRCRRLGVTPDNIDEVMGGIVARYV